MPRVLMVLTGAKTWTMKNGSPHPTGFWAEEFVGPHRIFTEAGVDVSVATPGGVKPTVDPLSLDPKYNEGGGMTGQQSVDDQLGYLEQMDGALSTPLKLEEVDAANYDVVFLVGGHGPMQDMAVHPTVGDLLVATLDDPNKIVAAVCHGSAGFLPAHRPDGTWLFAGRELTGFSNEEETAATFAGNAPWLLEDRLRLAGARYRADPAWTPHVVVDGNLITGQQQVSAKVTAAAVMEKLQVTA